MSSGGLVLWFLPKSNQPWLFKLSQEASNLLRQILPFTFNSECIVLIYSIKYDNIEYNPQNTHVQLVMERKKNTWTISRPGEATATEKQNPDHEKHTPLRDE